MARLQQRRASGTDGDTDQRQGEGRYPRSAHLCIDGCQCARVPHPGNRSPPSGRLKNTLHPRRQIPYAYPMQDDTQTPPPRQALWLGQADLVARWCYTRGGVWKLTGSKGFPAPAFVVNQGRVKVWALSDIEEYERTHPEVRDSDAKHQKIVGYYRVVGRPYPEGSKPET